MGRGGWTPNAELTEFGKSLEKVEDALASQHRATAKQSAAKVSATRQSLDAFVAALATVGRDLERANARLTLKEKSTKEKSTRGRSWQLPRRQAPKTGRDRLALELQGRTLTFREARQVVDAIWESIKEALKRGDTVETPIGRFEVKERPEPKTRWQLGRLQRIYRRRKTVVFTLA
jgi:nucleoid DNA-binding protein